MICVNFSLLSKEDVSELFESFHCGEKFSFSGCVPGLGGFSFPVWKAIGFPFCDVTEPSRHFLVSVWMPNCLLESVKASKASLVMTVFISERALSCYSVQLNLEFEEKC